MKLKVFHKGLILTSLPLLVELLLIASLLLLLVQSDQEKARESDYRHYSSLNARMLALATESPYLLILSLQQGSEKCLDEYAANLSTLHKYADQARKLSEKHPELGSTEAGDMINKMEQLTSHVVEARRKGAHILELVSELPNLQKQITANKDMASEKLIRLVKQGEALTEKTQLKMAHIRDLQSLILSIGLVLNIAVSAALAIFYRREILQRIGTIIANTIALSQGKELAPRLEGADEIAQLDHSFHSMKEQLREASEREKDLFDNASDVICVLDAQDRFSKINRACLKFWGYAPGEMIGMSIWDLVANEQKQAMEAQLERTKSSSQPISFESILKHRNEKRIEVLWSALWSEYENSLFCIVHDVSERKQVERARQQFLAMISSDLKKPLSQISASVAKLLTEELSLLPAKAAEKMEMAKKNVNRLLGLVNDLLQVSEMDLASVEIKKETCSIEEVLYRSAQDVEAFADKHHVKLQVRSIDSDWYVDSNRVIQVLVNLLSNAIKFSPESATVVLSAEAQGDYVLCKVIDRGRGVPESHKQAIFEKFKQVEAADGKRKAGTGLGLPICKQIVEDHGGAIGVESAEGQGSTFWFRLPRDESASMKIRAGALARAAQNALTSAETSAGKGNVRAVPARKQPGKARINLAMKGVILVGIPVTFELMFVGALWLVLHQVDHQRAIELHQRMIAFDATKLMNDNFQFAFTIAKSKTLDDWLEIQRLKKSTEQTMNELLALVKDDPKARNHVVRADEARQKGRPFLRHAEEVMAANNNNPACLLQAFSDRDMQIFRVMGFAHRIQKVIDDAEKVEMQSPENQKYLRQRQYQILIGGLAVNVLASLLLTIYFARDITGRLILLADNAQKLAADEPLNPELGGADEIANLDRIFHQTAAILSAARQKERAVFDNSQDVICAVSADGAFSSINSACAKVWGYSKEEMRSLSLFDLTAPEDREMTAKTLLSDLGKQNINFESRVLKKDGSEMWALWSASRAPEKPEITFCIVHDITDKKELEKLKHEFLAMVSHDLRTPLTSISGIAKLILAGAFGPPGEAPAKTLHAITKSGEKLLDLINDLLDIEKLEANKMQLVISSHTVGELLSRAVSSSHEPKSIHVNLDETCKEVSAECDGDRISQAITNLLNFSLTRCASDKTVALTTSCLNQSLEIKIKDCGSTIPAQVQACIFKRFKEAGALKSAGLAPDSESLSGLALPLAHKIVESHGGSLRLVAGENEATFILTLPILPINGSPPVSVSGSCV